jgi:DNA-binding transcriptional LysR family regulator
VPIAALSRERYLAREPGSGTRAVADSALAAVGVELVPALEVSSAEGLKRAVLSGGFALLSARTIELELATGALVARPVAGVELHRSFRAVRRTRPRLDGPAARFWRWLETTVAVRRSA